VRLLVVGGEKASRALHGRWRAAVGERPRFDNSYGPTETTVTATLYEPAAEPDDDQFADLPIGRPLPGVTCQVVDEQLRPVPDGEPGELCLGGGGVALGYLNLPERTAAVFVPDPQAGRASARMYRTGDRVRRLPDGRLIFLGRMDKQIKVRGFRVEPAEIESCLDAHPAVAQAIVVAEAAAEDGGSAVLRACLRLRDGHAVTQASLRDHLTERLPAYMLPARIDVVEAFPLLPNGKVDRAALAASNATRPQTGTAPNATVSTWEVSSDLARWLSALYAEVLGLDTVDPRASFFDLGGHSLRAIRLLSRIAHERPELQVSFELLFVHPSVQALAEALGSPTAPGGRSIVRLNRRQPAIETRTPVFCLCGVALYAELARALGDDRPVHGVFLPVEVEGVQDLDLPDLRTMAAGYAGLIAEHTPTGPCIVAGVSFGATLAFEVARLLAAVGREVELLVLLDPLLVRSFGWAAPVEALQRRWARRVPPSAAENDESALGERRQRALDRAEEAYAAALPHYGGRTLVIEASGRADEIAPSPRRPDLGWRGRFVRKGLGWTDVLDPQQTTLTSVQGDHLGILKGAGAFGTAQAVRDALAGR
jgi:aspartate racemase